MVHLVRAGVASVLCAAVGAARGQLTGVEISVLQIFEGGSGTVGSHVYGLGPAGATVFPDFAAPQFTWTATSPAVGAPGGADNSLSCDYTNFHSGLAAFAGTTTSLIINTVTVAALPGSVRVFNSAGTEIGQGGVVGTMIPIEVAVDDVRAGPTPTMIVVWDNAGVACYPDCNADGVLTVADFGCFQTAFVAGDPYADCNADGVLAVADFGCFQTGFVAGCP
jgi:hypothetical protein